MAKQTKAQRRSSLKNIEKAQKVWDKTHYSVAEGKIEPRIASGVGYYYFRSKHKSQKEAMQKADNIRNRGFKARVKYLTIAGKNIFLVYKGGKRKRSVKVAAGTGPKGQYHKGYQKSGPKWSGYGKKERPGLGKGR